MSLPRTRICLLAFATLFLLAPQTSAQSAGSNQTLTDAAPDVTPWLVPLSSVQFCFLDDNGDGSFNPGEPVSLRVNGCSSVAGAIRLTMLGDLAAGAFIASGEIDGRSAQTAFTPEAPIIRYLDQDSNGRLSHGDTVYVDTLNPTTGRVEVGDVRLTALGDAPAGSHVASGDDDVGASVGTAGDADGLFAYADVNGNVLFDRGDRLFLKHADTTFERAAQLNDLRLGGAQAENFGTWLELGDPDAPGILNRLPAPSVCIAKDQPGYQPGDVVIVRASGGCTGQATQGDVVLTRGPTDVRLASGDSATGKPLHGLTASFRFREGNGFSGYGVGDGLYLELSGDATRIDAGDIRLTPWQGLAAATTVRSGDADAGLHSDAAGPVQDHLSFLDADGNGAFDRADLLYYNADAGTKTDNTEDVEVSDTRLGAGPGGLFFGSQVTSGSPELVTRIRDRGFNVCVLDEDLDGSYDPGEAVYLEPLSCGSVSVNAVRLVPVNERPAGTQVQGGEEAGNAHASVPFDVVYHDADISSSWTTGDTLYLHFGTSGQVGVGDIRLTPYGTAEGGRRVLGGDPDLNVGTVSFGSGVSGMGAYVDIDRSGDYGQGDIVYLDPVQSNAQTANFGMVRLTALQPAQTAPTTSPTPGPTTTPPHTDPVDPTPGPTSDVPPDTGSPSPGADTTDPGDDGSPRTPGPGLALILCAVAAMLWFARRH